MKIGDYVRTKYGIRPIVDLRKNGKDQIIMVIIRGNQLNQIGLKMEYIKKHSPNLIDLIEVGDYVNGWLINEIISNYDNGKKESNTIVGYKVGMWGTVHETFWDDEEIKEILTKEQYEREVYRV